MTVEELKDFISKDKTYIEFYKMIDDCLEKGYLREPDPEKDKSMYDRTRNDDNENVKRLYKYNRETSTFELCRGIELKVGDLVLTVFKNDESSEKKLVSRLWVVVRDSLVHIKNGEENKKTAMFLYDGPIQVSAMID